MEQVEQVTAHDHAAARATTAGIGAMVLWSTSGVCGALGARAVGTLPYVVFTCLLGVLTIVVVRLVQRRPVRQLFTPPWRVVVAGFFGVAVYDLLLIGGLGSASEAELGQVLLLNYLWPVWMIVLSLILLPIPVRLPLALAGAGLGFAGVALALEVFNNPKLPENAWPHLMTFSASFLWALYSVLLRRWKIPTEQAGSTLQFLVCAVMTGTFVSLWSGWAPPGPLRPSALIWVVYGGIGPVGFAYYWWEIAVKRGNVHLVALLSYFIPIASVALMALAFHRSLSPWLLPGAGLIALGAYLGQCAAER